MMQMLKAYEISVIGTEWTRVVHAMSGAKAKYSYLLDVREAWPDINFKNLRCRLLGEPRNNPEFEKTAAYRGVPFAKIGMRVEVGGHAGVIVDKNSSANFDVLFTEGKHAGATLNCHPNWMFKYFDEAGNLIKEFRDGAA